MSSINGIPTNLDILLR